MSESKNVILFTGAGLSNILGLPVAREFGELIASSRKYQLNKILELAHGENIQDIEYVMYSLEEFIGTESKTIDRVLINQPHFFLSSTGESQIDLLKNNVKSYLTYLKGELYKILDDFDITSSSDLYLNILKEINTVFPNSKKTIFTTNYDLTFEKSLTINSKQLENIGINNIHDGFEREFTVLKGKFSVADREKPILEYYKLHGSIDWHYDEHHGCTKAGTNANPSDPNRMPILYPGFKGKPTTSPFIELHELFYKRCTQADVLLIVGFALRDPYINELIKYSGVANKNLKIYYFNPVEASKLPKESGVSDLMLSFGDRFKYKARKVENNEHPFGHDWL